MKKSCPFFSHIGVFMTGLLAFGQMIQPAQAATLYWDADEDSTGNLIDGTNLGGTGLWNTVQTSWWNLTADVAWPNTTADEAVFTGEFVVGGPTLQTVTLASGLVANKLAFVRSGYTLAGGDLTLAGTSPTLQANLAEVATIDSLIQGTDGLTKTGGGTVRLGNAGNTYTGPTTISNGILSIGSSGALGTDVSTITVTGSATRGFGGGALMLAGGYTSGVTLTRSVSLQGLGPVPASGAALLSIGNNTITGTLNNGTGAVSTGIHSAGGRLTLGDVAITGTAGTTLLTVGAGGGLANVPGVGSYAITGVLSGSGSIQKSGGGTLILAPSDASGFSGTVRIYSGSVRVESPASLGINAVTGTGGMLDLAGDGAILELRMDAPLIGKNIYNRGGGSPTIFVDHAIGSNVLNGNALFGSLSFDDGETLTFSGRNGYGATLGPATVITGDGNSAFTNNMGGQLVFIGDFWSNANNSGNRTMTVGGTGNILISGDIIASASAYDHILTKSGAGTLTVMGTASTLDGPVNINAGSVVITDFRSLTNNTDTINMGATTTAGILSVGTTVAPTADGLITSKTINLAGTTGGATINASQSGANPVVFNSNFTATGTGTKTLTLGGSNTADNLINGSIPDSGGTNVTLLRKADAGTWVLAGANAYSGSTQISNGILKLQDSFAGGSRNIVSDTSAIGFMADVAAVGAAGGTFQYVGAAGAASSETVGPLMLAAGAGTVRVTAGAGGTASLTLAAIGTSQTTTAASSASTTITVASTAGLVPGMRVNGGSAAATITSITNGTQIVVSAAQTIGSSTTLTFDRPNGGAPVNFDPDASSNVIIGTVPAIGLLNSYSYFKGADFAYADGTSNVILRAPVYNVDPGFVSSGAGTNVMSATNHYELTGNVTAQAARTINSLKMMGGTSLDLTGLLTIQSGAAGTSGGILVSGGTATISGTGVTTGGAADLIIRVDGASDVLNLNAPVTSATTGGLTKTGAGTLVIGALNAHTTGGSTNLLEGTIRLAAGGRLSADSVNLVMRQGTTLDLNGISTARTATTSSIGAFNGAGTVTNTSSGAVVFAVGGGTTGGSGTFNGTINEVSGQINVVKMGTTNSQVWNGVSNYTGTTTIGVPGTGTTGTVTVSTLANIGVDSSIGRGDATDVASNAGSLILGGTTGGLIYAGTTSVSTDRLFTMAGTVATAGATITNNSINNQALIFSNAGPIAFLAPNRQLLQLGGSSTSDNWFYPQITDSGGSPNVTSLNKLGAGIWILGNTSNSYSGTTTVTDGSLLAQDGTSLPTASGLILGGTTTSGVFQSSGDFTRSIVASASAGFNTVSWNSALTTGGGGFAASNAKLVVSMGGLNTPTPLIWNEGGFMGTTGTTTGSLVLNSTTALNEVEFRNAIDLNGAVRTITVNDNTSTLTDFATITGVISGTGGISKAGAGMLQLFGDNTYVGTTAVTAGPLTVTSLGNSATPGPSSLGDSTNGHTTAGALTLGNAGTGAGILLYVGAGEVSDRMIRLNTTTGSTQIHADGSGPLILTNVVNDMAAGAKSLYLRGANTQGNMITSTLANNGGNLSIVVDQGATWILGGENTYSGNTTVSSGALGAASDTAFGTSTLLPRNGALFAYGGDRTLANPVTVASTTSGGTFGFIGDYNLTMTADWNYSNTTASHTITNGIAEGRALTLDGDMVLNALTGSISVSFNGTGDTVFNGDITTTTTFNGNLSYSGDGTLTLSGANTTAGNTTLNNANGTLRLIGAGRLGTGSLTVNAGSLLIESISQSVTTLAMGNVANTTATINVASGLTLSTTAITFSGTTTLPASITGGGTLDLGTAGITVTVADNITQEADMLWTIDNLTGSGVFTKAGAGVLDLSGVANNSFTGSYQINAGAIMGLDGLTNNLALNGGVYQGFGAFTRGLGTGSNQVQWLALGGGFAAVGGDLTVTLTGVPGTLVWGGTPSFVPNGAPLIFGSAAADGITDFTHNIDLNGATRTISVVDNTAVTTDSAVLSGVLSNGAITKTGNGILRLSGANTFTGAITVTAGTLQFSTVSNNGGGPSNLGQGTDGITLGGGTLSFMGDGAANSQSTNRAITLTASSTLNAGGTNGASITYSGPIASEAVQLQLTGLPSSAGFITGGITQTSAAPDLLISSGNWTISNTPIVIGDDIKVNGTGTVLNLNTPGVVSFFPGTSNFLYIGNGGTINLNANDVSSAELGLEGILPGFEAVGAAATFNVNTYNITTPRLDVGQIGAGFEGNVIGSGTVTVTVTTAGSGLNLYRGSVSANLAGPGALFKAGMGDVILSGDNSGLTGTIRLDAGNLILDYATSNTAKLNSATALDMRGGTLTINGSNSAATVYTAASFTLGSGGSSKIIVNSGTGQEAVVNLGAISRGNGSQDGTVRFVLPSGTQSATNGITTATVNGTHGLLGASGFAIVKDSTGTWFATNATNLAGGNIVGLVSTVKNDVTSWVKGDHVTDATTGFTGTLGRGNINSLRFDAANGAGVNIVSGGVLNIASGGILITDNVASGTPGILGGTLVSGVTEIIVTQDSAQIFEISSDIRINHSVTKTGPGALLLSGNNVYTDETELQEGTLQVSGGNAIGDTSLVTLADDRYNALQLLADETIGRLAGGSATDGLRDLATVDVGNHTLTLTQNAASTYGGLLTGSGTMVKNGPLFDLTLSNISTGFSGVLRINGGGVILSGVAQLNATSIEINKGGYLRLVDSSSSRSGTRLLDDVVITLNSADGGIAGNLLPRGLYINTDQDTTLDETVGVITLGSGASYATLEATTANDDSDIIMNNLLRTHHATLNVRGTNLGTTNAQNNQFRIGNAANQTAFIATLVGGAGAAGTQNISIVPWAIGETLAGALAAPNMGNSLVTYVSGAGFRPLDFDTEYDTFTLAAATDNVRESLTTDLTTLAGKTINSLVIHNNNSAGDSTVNVLGSGAAQTLVNTSGVFLFTLNPAAAESSVHSINLGGFDGGIQVGSSGEYVFHVNNPVALATTPALTAVINSALTSTADITKSGRGTLILTGANTAGGGASTTTINEGTLQIGSLANIGGSTGGLVFAGGTLRLSGSYSGEDLSTRAISFLLGGGTLDTNGHNLTFANSLGMGAGGFTKIGGGTLTLNAPAGYTGPTSILAGSLVLGASNAIGSGALTINDAALDVGANNVTVGLVTLLGPGGYIAGNGTVTSTAGYVLQEGTVDAVLAGAVGLVKNTAATVVLTNDNTFTGGVEVQAGILSFDSIGNVGGGASALGAPTTVQAGTLNMGLTSATTTLNYAGAGHTSDRLIAMQGTTGGVVIDADGTGALGLGSVVGVTAGAKTLTLQGSSAANVNNSIGTIDDFLGTLAVLKTEGNTWELNSSNTYSGATSINNGILRLNAVQSMAGALNFGSSNSTTTAGTLQLRADASFASLTVQTNSGTNTNNLVIDSGRTLTISGNVVIGSGVGALSTTLLNASGGGSLVVVNDASSSTFRVGGSASNGNVTLADLSSLDSLAVSLNTTNGIFRVNSTSGTNVNGTYSRLILADNSTITASALSVGDGGQNNGSVEQINQLVLGTGVTTFNVGALNIGTGSRDLGSITFLDTTGTLTVRGADGIGAAALNMGSGSSTTAAALLPGNRNTFDVSGHNADLLLGAMSIGTQNGRSGPMETLFAFDTGILAAGNLTMGSKTQTGNSTNVMNLGGGTVTIGSGTGTAATLATNANTGAVSSTINVTGGTVTIGAGSGVAMALGANNTNATGTATGTLNVSGGSVTLATTGTTAVTLATGTAGTATGRISITGGTVTVMGDINRGVGGATRNAEVILNGGSLDMTGRNMGALGNAVVFTAQAGTLTGLGELNGGGSLSKTTTGVLSLGNGNTYTGGTSIAAGTVLALNTTGSATGSGGVTVLTTGVLGGIGRVAGNVQIDAGGTLSPGANNAGQLTIGGSLDIAAGGILHAELGGITTNDAVAVSAELAAHGNLSGLTIKASYEDYQVGITQHDSINVTGASSPVINGTFQLGAALNGYVPQYGDIFDLLDWAALSGITGTPNFDFSGITLGAGLGFNTDLFASNGILVVVDVVPEPSRALLLMFGLLGLLGRRRRR